MIWLSHLPLFFCMALALWPFSSRETERPPSESSVEVPAGLTTRDLIRVSVLKGIRSLNFQAPAAFRAFDAQGRRVLQGDGLKGSEIAVSDRGIRIGSQNISTDAVTFVSEGASLKVEGKAYRHAVTFVRGTDKSLTAVNELPIEDYLTGVLPMEVQANWPAEALKAQAVAARTYALFRKLQTEGHAYDVTSDVSSQVYGGQDKENPLTTQAVRATEGQVLLRSGKLFPAFFHSTCGGHTSAAETVWRILPNPALMGTTCDFCRGSKHYEWKESFSAQAIEEALTRHGVPVKKIQRLDFRDRDASGRYAAVEVHHAGGRERISSNDFRIWLDPFRFKSTLIDSVTPSSGGFEFRGKGWGHGVGMCQYGARQLASLGYNYRQILAYYFPGAEVRKVLA